MEHTALAGVRVRATETRDQPRTQCSLRSLRVVFVVAVVVRFHYLQWCYSNETQDSRKLVKNIEIFRIYAKSIHVLGGL